MVQTNGAMQTETTLDRPLGATPLRAANVSLPQGLCKEAFLDAKGNCVAVQLSALLKLPLESVECEIDAIYRNLKDYGQYEIDGEVQSWRQLGVTSRIVIELGNNHGMNVHVLQNGRKISAHRHGRMGQTGMPLFQRGRR